MNIKLSKQRGLSLVELMIALVLSLVVWRVTTGIYVSNKQTYRFLDQYSAIQENGRFAIFFLREHILQAGFPRQANVNPFPVVATNSGYPGNDNVIVQFRAAVDCVNAAAPLVGGIPTATNTIAININQQLTCNGQPLVDGIQSMQVEYGVDTDNDGIANTYAHADDVQASIAGASWNDVVSVRVAVLVQGQPNTLDQVANMNFNLLDLPVQIGGDRTPRRVFTTTIPLRNRNKSII